MVELVFSLAPFAFALVALHFLVLFGYRLVRAVSLGSAWEEVERSRLEPAWVPSELDVATARLRRARRQRRELEISDWDAAFGELVGGCPHCAGRRLR